VRKAKDSVGDGRRGRRKPAVGESADVRAGELRPALTKASLVKEARPASRARPPLIKQRDTALRHLAETVVARGWVEQIGQPNSDGAVPLTVREHRERCTVWVRAEALTRQPVPLQSVVAIRSAQPTHSEQTPASDIELVRAALAAAGDESHWALRIRSPAARAAAMARHRLESGLRRYLEGRECIAVQPPLLAERSGGAAEATAMPDRSGRTALLRHAGWMYVDSMVTALERVYALSPVFQAGSGVTPVHQARSWILQAEVAWASHEEIMQWEEGLMRHLAQQLMADRASLLEPLGVDLRGLEIWRQAFPIISYDEALKILTRAGHRAAYGCEFTHRERAVLDLAFETPYFVTDLPTSLAPLVTVEDPKQPGVTRSHWLMPRAGQRALSVGGERMTEWVSASAQGRGAASPAAWQSVPWFADTRRFGCVPHSGFELDFDQLCQTLLGGREAGVEVPGVG